MNIGILGGDLRIIFLSKMLIDDGYRVYSYGIENELKYNKTVICNSIYDVCRTCDTIVSAVPFSKDGININSPFSDKELSINDVFKDLQNKRLIAGSIKTDIKKEAEKFNIEVIDILEDEALTILNIIPTVEGAIEVAMQNTKHTIHDSNCLILGYGRIGKYLSKILKNLGANVSVEARNKNDISWIKLNRYKDINLDVLDENLSFNRYDIIFNTIPRLILDDKRLETIKGNNKDTVIIELASNPGGINFVKAEKYKLKVIKALGLPGKVAPTTSAKYIKDTIDKILK